MKRVLIITYYWPPSGGGGVQRWLKFAKYLPEFGWQPVIYTPENPDFEIRDPGLENDINPLTEVIRTPIWEPFEIYRKIMGKNASRKQGVVSGNKSELGKMMVWFRANIFIPDPRKFWIKPSTKFLLSYLKEHPVDVIVSTGPPHSMHIIGLNVGSATGIPWIADFRDPWSDWDVLDLLSVSKKSRKKHKKLEAQVFNNASIILTVSKRLSEKLKSTGGITHVEVITNGYDDSDFGNMGENQPDKFRISHFGLLNNDRNPVVFWEVLEKLCEENEKFRNDLEVFLAGTIEDDVKAFLENKTYLKNQLSIVDYIPHEEVFKQYTSSFVLLLLVNNTSNAGWIIPAKLFEYLNVKVPILAFGTKESDANDVLENAGHPSFIEYNDVEETRSRILEHYRQFCDGEKRIPTENVIQYSRKTLTGRLSEILEKITNEA